MSNPNPERDERGVRRIRKTLVTMQRMEHDDIHAHVYVRDVTKLLSLLDSQAAARPIGWISCGLRHGHDRIVDIVFENAECAKAFIDNVEPTVGPIVAATRMRDRCVEKVRDALLDHAVGCGNALYCDCGTAANREFLIELLQSLTFEGEQEK